MTVRLLLAYAGYPANAIVTLDTPTETGLINAKMADSNLTGGVVYSAPAVPAARITADNCVLNAAGTKIIGLVNPDGTVTGVDPSSVAITGGMVGFTAIPTSSDFAGIVAAYNKVVAAGGGTVMLMPVTYNMGANTLPISSKVRYQGGGWALSMPVIPDMYNVDVTSGTILLGDGTAPGIAFNTSDHVVPYSTQGDFNAQALVDSGFSGIAFKNFSYGARIGGNYNPGAFYSAFKDCVAIGCGWGFWFENMIHCFYDQLYAFGCTVGQIQFRSSASTAILAPANCRVGEICATTPANLLSRGIEVSCTNSTIGGLAQSGIIQCNRFANPTFTPQNAVCSGTSSVAVTDTTKLAVDLPITFASVGATGLSTAIVYFVASIIDATHITIANTMGGTALVPTAGTASLTTKGFAPFTVVGYGASDRAQVSAVNSLDLEAGGTAKLIVQNAVAGGYIALTAIAKDGSSSVDVVVRNTSYLTLAGSVGLDFDFDAFSTVGNVVTGTKATFVQRTVGFFGRDASLSNQPNVLNLANSLGSTSNTDNAPYTLVNRAPGNGDFTYPGRPLGVKQGWSTATLTVNMGSPQAGCGVFTGSSPVTWTWGQGVSATTQGFRQTFKNAGTAALTVTLGASDGTFDGLTAGASSGKSITVSAPTGSTPGGVLTIICAQTGASSYQWCIETMTNCAFA